MMPAALSPVAPGRGAGWTLPVALSAIAHVGWLVALGVPEAPVAPSARADASPARVVFAPVRGGEMDARWIGSPVIFSMPGGPGSAAGSEAGARPPPVTIPGDPPPGLARSPEPAPSAVLPTSGARMTPVWQAPAPRPNPPPLPLFDMKRVDAPGGMPPGWAFAWTSEHGGKNPWEAEVHIEMGADGLPVSAIVDSADAPEAARILMSRTAFSWRLPAGEAPASFRLRVRYTPGWAPPSGPADEAGRRTGDAP